MKKINYTSDSVLYDKFKTFSVKIVLTSNSSVIVQKVRDVGKPELDV